MSSVRYDAVTVEGRSLDRRIHPRIRGGTDWIDSEANGASFSMKVLVMPASTSRPPSRWSRSRSKRIFDCACVLPALVLLAPVLLAIAAAVRITSQGPVLFLQRRIGRYGGSFTIAKFRTLVHSSEVEHRVVTTESNQQFTPIGQFLRRWKLDELPQLVNVLMGDMSLVGPRPKVEEHRLSVLTCRPGITGAATVAFADEEMSFAQVPKDELESFYRGIVLPAKRQLDDEYMAGSSVISDVKMLIKSVLRRWDMRTMNALLAREGYNAEKTTGEENAKSAPGRVTSPSGRAALKLAILGTRGIPARYGGFETFAEQLAVRLARRGINATVYCPSKAHRGDGEYQGVRLSYVTTPRLSVFSEVAWDVKCFWKARSRYDVVYMLGVGAAFVAWIPRMFGAVAWINCDGLEWKRTKWSLAQRAYLIGAEAAGVLCASRIVADAKAVAEHLRRRFPEAKNISTISYGADIPPHQPSPVILESWELKTDGYYLIVCRLEPENHVLEILKGFQQTKTALPLVVIGDIDRQTAYVRELLAFRSDRIHFVGTVYDQVKLCALRYYCRAYFHGHSVGGTNPSLLEAMACSNAVIAHDNCFNREVLGASGQYWTTSDEVTSLVEALDEGRADALARGVMAKEIVRARYQWDRIADSYLELLNDIAEEKVRTSTHQAGAKALHDANLQKEDGRDEASEVPVQVSERLG
jgi:lipopolysaccharide/colanic/teichoic acid biosynthesis glycosyltransferase/glycosyltransferase involved in cell wall biosynthesis